MAKRPGISGLAVSLVGSGLYLVYAGLRNVPLLDGLRDLAAGKLPAARPPKVTTVTFDETPTQGIAAIPQTGVGGSLGAAVGSVALNARILQIAESYLGVIPYVWGGESVSGADCSGFVTLVLKQAGVTNLPNMNHTVTGQFLRWSGATTVPRDQTVGGDLVCWAGHIGIAIDRNYMVNNSHPGTKTSKGKITGSPAIRRVKV